MGMSTDVIGFKLPDEKWLRMKKIYDSYSEAKMDIPEDIMEYFNYAEPDSAGVEVKLKTSGWTAIGASGIEIDISKLDKDVKIIRFYNSW